ncbi:hypothetical protein QE152_g7875 [Popillia japonica]|uniref:Uncharacterized protein n=1 Tax=Popillia japonica TaxID=7064 RepID=A0AAW1MDB1_POPJA
MIAEHRDATYTNRLRKINAKDGSIWKMNKHLRKSYHRINALRQQDGTMIMEKRYIAEMLAAAFREYHNMPLCKPSLALRTWWIGRPVLLHGAAIWSNARPVERHINRLQVQQNKCLRIILGADMRTSIAELHQAAGIPLVADYLYHAAQAFYDKTLANDNPLIRGITNTRMVREKHRMLYQHLPLYNMPIA